MIKWTFLQNDTELACPNNCATIYIAWLVTSIDVRILLIQEFITNLPSILGFKSPGNSGILASSNSVKPIS